MEQPVKNKIISIIQRFFAGDPASLQNKSENELVEVSVTFITQVMMGIFRRKRMRPYLMQLLDIPAVTEQLVGWRCSKIEKAYDYLFEGNILHLACESYDKAFIIHVIEKCGKELMFIPNYDNVLPINMLQYNHHSKDIHDILKYFHENGADLTQLKMEIVDLYDTNQDKNNKNNELRPKRTMREIIRFLCDSQLLTPDDTKRIELSFKSACDLNYWRLGKGEHKFPTLNKELIYFYTLVVKSQPPRRESDWLELLRNNRLMSFFFGTQDELVDVLIRNRFVDEDVEDLLSTRLGGLRYANPLIRTKIINFLVTYLPLMRNNKTLIEDFGRFDPETYLWISQLKLHTYDIPEEYLLALKPCVESWIFGPVFSKHEQIDFALDIQKLPSDLIAQVLGFVPYKSVRAFSLTCKKFSEFVAKNLLIWQALSQKYFPLDYDNFSAQKINENSFLTKFKDKFVKNSNQSILVRAHRGFKSLEVTQNFLIWSSPDHFGVFNTENYSGASKEHSFEYNCFVRMYNDILFVKSTNKLETYAKHNLHKISSYDLPNSKEYFAVNDRYLFTNNFAFDLQAGEVVVEFPRNRLQHCVVRDNICYGYSGSFLCAIDPRANPAVIFNVDLDFNTSQSNQAVLNVYDNHIYTAHDLVEIFDIRMMNQSRKSPTEIGRNKIIDLVSMNVWSDQVVWDLTDLEWNYIDHSGPALETRLSVCNGKQLIYSSGYTICGVPLSGSHYFPYGDYRT